MVISDQKIPLTVKSSSTNQIGLQMLKLHFPEEPLGWLTLYAHSAGQTYTWDNRHTASSHPNLALGNLSRALTTHILYGYFHVRNKSLIAYLYSNTTDLLHLVTTCSILSICCFTLFTCVPQDLDSDDHELTRAGLRMQMQGW